MRIIVENVKSKVVIGGKDNLLPYDLMEELREYLRVRPDGYSHTPAYKKKQWDGWRYFITNGGVFATGFLPLVVKYLEELGVEVQIEDNRTNLPVFNEELDCTLPNGWEIDEHRLRMLRAANHYEEIAGQKMYFPRGVIDAATNAGKTSICAGVFNNVQKPKLLYLLHSQTIFRQAVEFFGELFPRDIGQIGLGKFEINNFTIAMVKTLYNNAQKSMNVKKALQSFNILIVDEAHKAGGEEYSKLLQMVDAGMRLFVSGTPLENTSKVNNMIIVGLAGPTIGKVTNQELIETGHSLKPIVNIFLNDTIVPSFDYQEELKNVVQFSEKKAEMIADLVVARDGKQILISFIEIKHGYFLKKMIESHPEFFGRCEIVHGTDGGRYHKIEDFKKGKIDVLLTSTILKEGVNIPNIEVLIMAQGGKSTITVKQFVGRALRTDGKNDTVEIIDFYDVGRYVAPHSRKRLKIYRDEGFDVTVHYEERRNKPVRYLQY